MEGLFVCGGFVGFFAVVFGKQLFGGGNDLVPGDGGAVSRLCIGVHHAVASHEWNSRRRRPVPAR